MSAWPMLLCMDGHMFEVHASVHGNESKVKFLCVSCLCVDTDITSHPRSCMLLVSTHVFLYDHEG